MPVNSQQVLSTNDLYDQYTHIETLLQEKKTWRQIESIIGKDKSWLYRYYKREKARRFNKAEPQTTERKKSKATKSTKPNSTQNNNHVGRQSFISPKESVGGYSVDEFPRLPKYGHLPPTGFKSELSDDEWIVKYGGESYGWVLSYLTRMRLFLRKTVKGIVYLPRGHGKTKSVIGLYARDILEIQLPIMIIVSGPSAQRKLFREFKRILMSETVRRDYGDILISYSMNTCEMYLREELSQHIDAVCKVVGRGGDVIGSHPTRIHLEDIVQEEFKSDESNEALREWYSEVIKYCATDDTRITATGTRKGIDDFYSWLVTQNYEVLHNRAIELKEGRWPDITDLKKEQYDDGSGLLRERITGLHINGTFKTLECPNWSLESLLKARILSPPSFESQMQNNPLPSEGLYFDRKDFVVINSSKYNNNDYNDYYIFIDSAYGKSNKADNTSILVVCVIPPKLVIVDGIIDRLTWNELEGWLERYISKYNPNVVYIEENTWQVWLVQNTKAMGWPIVGVNQKKNKILRISATKVHWIEKRIEILDSYPGREQLYQEYVLYDETPSTSSKKDDGLDTVAMACEELAQYVRSDKISWFN